VLNSRRKTKIQLIQRKRQPRKLKRQRNRQLTKEEVERVHLQKNRNKPPLLHPNEFPTAKLNQINFATIQTSH
jgi:hypothetical protein